MDEAKLLTGKLELTVPGMHHAGWTLTGSSGVNYYTPFPSRVGLHVPALNGVTHPVEAEAVIRAALTPTPVSSTLPKPRDRDSQG